MSGKNKIAYFMGLEKHYTLRGSVYEEIWKQIQSSPHCIGPCLNVNVMVGFAL